MPNAQPIGPREIENSNPCNQTICEPYPKLERMNYCHGQMLSAQDFVDEQSYFLNKIALLTRCTRGYGVDCGLEVDVDDELNLAVTCGVAIDPLGRELVHRTPFKRSILDMVKSMYDRGVYEVEREKGVLFKIHVTVRYQADPTRPQDYPNSGCCGTPDAKFATRWTESPCIELTCDAPPTQTCDSCCQPLKRSSGKLEERLWLATIWVIPTETIRTAKDFEMVDAAEFQQLIKCGDTLKWLLLPVDNTIRRHLSTYVPTRISGLSWVHGAAYSPGLTKCMLERGLEISFSAPIDRSSVLWHDKSLSTDEKRTNEIAEIWISDEPESGKSDLQVYQSRIEVVSDRKIKIQVERPSVSSLSRVFISLRSDFILDQCNQAVDGNHIGGIVPFTGFEHGLDEGHWDEMARLIEFQAKRHFAKLGTSPSYAARCKTHPLYSGNGIPGSDFQSWFYVSDQDCN